MIIYNLTDKTPPWEKTPRTPNKLKIRGVVIFPGQSYEFNDFSLAEVAGHINAHRASVDGIPAWYQAVESSEKEKQFKEHFAQVLEREIPEKEKVDDSKKFVKVDVGAMEVEVTPGKDGDLGTDDDEVKIKPKNRKKGGGKK